MMTPLEIRIARCERANTRLRNIVVAQALLWPLLAVLLGAGVAMAGRPGPAVLKVREVAVVDAAGVVRARLGGELPDAHYPDGRISKRGPTAGLLIYDEQGIERGGYVTQGPESNAMLTLDSKQRQAALFVVGPDQAQVSSLRLWRPGASIELRSDEAGARLSVNDASGVVLQQPTLSTLPPAICTRFAKLERERPGERICSTRFGETACRRCTSGE